MVNVLQYGVWAFTTPEPHIHCYCTIYSVVFRHRLMWRSYALSLHLHHIETHCLESSLLIWLGIEPNNTDGSRRRSPIGVHITICFNIVMMSTSLVTSPYASGFSRSTWSSHSLGILSATRRCHPHLSKYRLSFASSTAASIPPSYTPY